MLILGMDTGGTYTDGVILDRETRRVLCTAKALTTHQNLTLGMEACMRALDFDQWEQIGQVSLSTTLATNAIVENKGSRVGLIVLGKKPDGPLPAEVCVELNAQVDIRGGERERLTEQAVQDALGELNGRCAAVAISGYASVRNPMHELQVAQAAREILQLPVVCGHELTGALGFYERTVTAALNARLIPIIHDLILTVRGVMARFAIQAPVFMVRGDGSLMRADYAMERPVETVLSGPAASVIGARFLSGRENCIVVDMGGTTTDIAYVKDGRCRGSEEGARLGRWRTRVRALDICTFGLGGDSELRRNGEGVTIGPQRILPFCRAQAGESDAGLTPTDLLHVTGECCRWDARQAAEGLCAAFGDEAGAVKRLRTQVVTQLAAYCAQGMQAFGTTDGAMLVGVGAPAHIWLTDAAKALGVRAEVPKEADVANAVGAAAGKVQERSRALIRRNKANGTYYVFTDAGRRQANDLAQAERIAHQCVGEGAADKARYAGAAEYQITLTRHEIRGDDGAFIEIQWQAEACGYPT